MTRRQILLVEDNPSDIELTKRAFERNKIANAVVVAEDGEAALDHLFGDATRDLPAIVFLDLNLPRVDGLDVLRRIRAEERTRTLPVVVLTTSKGGRDMAESYRLGANSYVRKPVSFTEFCETVAQLGLYWLVLNETPPAPDEGHAAARRREP